MADQIQLMRERLNGAESVTLPKALAIKILDRLEAAEAYREHINRHTDGLCPSCSRMWAEWQQTKAEHEKAVK